METVRVIYHHETDDWWAESSDVEGWSAAGTLTPRSPNWPVRAFPSPLSRDDVVLEHFVPVGESIAA
jgi:hypothetical protein